MDPISLMALFGGAGGMASATPSTGMAALLGGGATAGMMDPNLTSQLAANPEAALTLGGAGVMSPEMTQQMAQNVPSEAAAGLGSNVNPLEGIPLKEIAQVVGQPDNQQKAPGAPSVAGGRGVDRAEAFKALTGGKRMTLAQLMGGR